MEKIEQLKHFLSRVKKSATTKFKEMIAKAKAEFEKLKGTDEEDITVEVADLGNKVDIDLLKGYKDSSWFNRRSQKQSSESDTDGTADDGNCT